MTDQGNPTYSSRRPVVATDLQVGRAYFEVAYVDADLLVPFFQPVVFLGKAIDGGDDGLLYFQDASSYFAHGPDPGGEAQVVGRTEGQLNSIFELTDAIEELRECAARRV